MAVDFTKLMAVMQDALLRELGDEVDLIFRYGSQVKGNTHNYSDLDISYVPVHESTGHHITVLVDDILCDLYPIRWSQLESMAQFENVSSTLLLNYQLIYQRSDEAAAKIATLADQLQALLIPAARPTMVAKAQVYFQQVGYPFYLLCEQATAGHQLATLHHAQQLLAIVFHTLAIYNQQVIDTRKLDQVLALPELPTDFATTVTTITNSTEPATIRAAGESLLTATRRLLLVAQQQLPTTPSTFAAAFGAGYPELKGDLQHVLLGCERRDRFGLLRSLLSLYHELALVLAQGSDGVVYTAFNSLADYETALVAEGFPPLLPYVERNDFEGLRQQCLAFDQQLRRFMADHHANPYTFATVDALATYLEQP